MKTKHLLIPAIILAVLLACGLLLRRPSPPESRSAVDQAGMVRLVGGEYGEERIQRISISTGAPESREIVLVKSGGGAWTVKSAYDAPANAELTAGLLAALRNLTGDLHAEREESHKSLGVDAENALRVGVGLTESADDLVLYVGGAPGGGYGESYVRRDGESDVYRVPVDLRRAAGLRYAGAGLETKTWLDLNLFRAVPENMTDVELDYPGRKLAARREGGTGGDPAGAWTLSGGGAGRAFKPEAFGEWLGGLPSFAASGAADPSRMEEAARSGESLAWTLGFAGDSGGKAISMRMATMDGVHYIETSERPGLVYTVDDSGRDRAFPALASILDFRLLPESGAIDRVESGEWILTRESAGDDSNPGRWTTVPADAAAERREVETTAVEDYLKRLTGLEGSDFAPESAAALPIEKSLTVRVDGGNVVLSFGPEENGMRPAHAGEGAPLVVKADDVQSLFQPFP